MKDPERAISFPLKTCGPLYSFWGFESLWVWVMDLVLVLAEGWWKVRLVASFFDLATLWFWLLSGRSWWKVRFLVGFEGFMASVGFVGAILKVGWLDVVLC